MKPSETAGITGRGSRIPGIPRSADSFKASAQGSRDSRCGAISVLIALGLILFVLPAAPAGRFEGRHFRGSGDTEYIQLLDTARRMFEPDPELQSIPMLYLPDWNGLVEGPTWKAWWIQNSYGTTYCALPFYREPLLTFLKNSQDLWFTQMGDGRRAGCSSNPKVSWVAPDGALCDAAMPGCIIYKQGDGRTGIHDWGMEFTAAGVLLESELLLIGRGRAAIKRYLPLLERAANFIETRRDPKNNLFLAGPAANLLAPSYAGWRRPDGSYGQAYLAGLSITYIAALDRLIELEELAGAPAKAELYARRRDLAKRGLPLFTTAEGYFIKSLDPDGVRHGVFGAPRYGYFESSPNHDAIAFRVVDREQAERIYARIASIPQLRPYHFILPNYPSLDDMYEEPKGLWRFGHWVNGGHWSTCEARMMLGYFRLGKHEDARASMKQILTFARRFRMDNPLTNFGSEVYQPKLPINITYDAFGPAAAFLRGLFEYLYRANGLELVPHIPPGITELEQLDPIRFGTKELFLHTIGKGPVRAVTINGRAWKEFNTDSLFLPYDRTPVVARIVIRLGDVPAPLAASGAARSERAAAIEDPRGAMLQAFVRGLAGAGYGRGYEAAHARLALAAIRAMEGRRHLQAAGRLDPLPEESRAAAGRSYVDTANRLCEGLDQVIASYEKSRNTRARRIARIYRRVSAPAAPRP